MNRSFKIGVWAPDRKAIVDEGNGAEGGAYYYTNKLYKILLSHQFSDDIKIVMVGYEINDQNYPVDKLSLRPLHRQIIPRLLVSIYVRIPFIGRGLASKLRQKHKEKSVQMIKDQGIDLLYYPKPGVEFPNFPFIATNWDLGHLSSYALPELTMNGNFESRDYYHRLLLQKALLICCESKAGKDEIKSYLGINPDRIEILPMFPGEVVEDHINAVAIDALTSEDFLFYPATYSSHKNHHTLLKAFALFNRNYPEVKLVLTGDMLDNKPFIDQCIEELDLQDKVMQLGVVDVKNLKWLYQNAIALVMPTLLGPTNMPLLEAYYLNCAVICSDIPGHREQLGDAGYYVDPLSADSIVQQMRLVYQNRNKRDNPITNHDIFLDTIKSLQRIFSKGKTLRTLWGKNEHAFKQ